MRDPSNEQRSDLRHDKWHADLLPVSPSFTNSFLKINESNGGFYYVYAESTIILLPRQSQLLKHILTL